MTHVMLQDRIDALKSELERRKRATIENIEGGNLWAAQIGLGECIGTSEAIDELESMLAVCQAEIDEMLEGMAAEMGADNA